VSKLLLFFPKYGMIIPLKRTDRGAANQESPLPPGEPTPAVRYADRGMVKGISAEENLFLQRRFSGVSQKM
jgi:hypothetical protein